MQSSRRDTRGQAAGPGGAPASQGSRRGRWMLLLIAFVCAAPVIASYFTYYVIKPHGGSTNYGTLIDPQRPIPPALMVTDETGKTIPLASLRGVWLLVMADRSACDEACATKLYFMRQVRATQAGERQRITTVWLRSDAGPIPQKVSDAYPDTRKFVADPAAVAAWLPADAGTQVSDHIYMVDPNGNLMMRFPKNPNPSKIKGDVTKLLKWSSIG